MAKGYFDGSIEELKLRVHELGLRGRWQEEPHGVFMFRSDRERAQLHWSSSRNTVWLTGQVDAQRQFLATIASALEERDNAPLQIEVR